MTVSTGKYVVPLCSGQLIKRVYFSEAKRVGCAIALHMQ